jgi:O-antigen/teichoic acid export membrane protein
LLHKSFDLQDVVIYQVISIAVGTTILYLFSRPYLLHRFNPTIAWVRRILGYGKFIFASGAVSNIFQNLDQLMIGILVNDAAVATYNAATRINVFLDTPSFAAADILFPKSSRASITEGPEKVRYLFERMVGILMAFTLPVSIFILIFPRLVIYLVAGRHYLDAVPILQLYVLAGLARPLQNQAANLLNSIGKPKITLYMNSFALAINLAINYVLLKEIGFYGAAVGTSISSAIILVAWYFLMKKQIGTDWRTTDGYMMDTFRMVFTRGKGFLMSR